MGELAVYGVAFLGLKLGGEKTVKWLLASAETGRAMADVVLFSECVCCVPVLLAVVPPL